MHVIEVVGDNPLSISPGRFLCEDVNAGFMLSNGWCKVIGYGVAALQDSPVRGFSAKNDWNHKKILFVRPGGFGDLLFLTPTIAEIKREWPDAKVHVACFDRYQQALLHNPDIAGFIPYPVPIEFWNGFDGHIWLENIIENNPEAKVIHAVDIIAKRVGLEFDDKGMRYLVTQEENRQAEREFPRDSERIARVGLQMTASGLCRIYPFMRELSQRLWRDVGCEVFLFAGPNEILTNEPEGIVNLSARNKTFRGSCAILETCDVLVGGDSALVHVAGALKIPCVALYGPFPWKLRTAYAPTTFALQGTCPVSPCFYHFRSAKGHFPDFGPCSATQRCEALAAIPVERIIREVEKRIEWAVTKIA